ncbi:hypothetical protein KAR91_17260, partial [Candidatus Pacearchaeota archaeon]|nr:hypothetical protein [Candidatus Pacearchaeota archaeon]
MRENNKCANCGQPRAAGKTTLCDDCSPPDIIGYRFRNWYIPGRMMPGIRRYIDDRIDPSGFLTAVICNDLIGAVGRADNENIDNLPAYVSYFFNEAPSSCWGSKKKMEEWLKGGPGAD